MTILDTIVAQKRVELARLPARPVTGQGLEAAVAQRGGVRDFAHALRHPPVPGPALIAEVKKASPSAGVIRPDFDPVRIARDYETAGATCLSVLTDERFFQGSLEFLREIRRNVRLPILRKDFLIDERQISEAVEWGADAILLIVSILTDDQLLCFQRLAHAAGLAVLVEVHDVAELDRALASGARLVGVNNRDLKTFRVDLTTTEQLAGRLAATAASRPTGEPLLVAESGIHTHTDVQRLTRAGASAILVGESLMRQPDLIEATRELLGRPNP